MKRYVRFLVPVLGLVALLVALSGCQLFSPPFVVSVSLASGSNQYPQNSDGSFNIYFPSVTATPTSGEVVSSGDEQGATVVSIDVKTNKTFYVTGAKIENVFYRPQNANMAIPYVNPVYGVVSPIFAQLPLTASTGTGAAIEMNPNKDNYIDLDLSSTLSMWSGIDADSNSLDFPSDQSEVIVLTCSVFLQGYLSDGTQFTGNFPPPVLLTLVVQHQP